MKRQFAFEPELFPCPTESEWEGEDGGTGPDYIRWVQASLNRILGLRLAVDGSATRSAASDHEESSGLV